MTVSLAEILDRMATAPAVQAIAASVTARTRTVVEGSQGSSTTLLAGLLAKQLSRPVLLLVGHLDDADHAAEDLALLAGPANNRTFPIMQFGALEMLPGESAVNLELVAERLDVVRWLISGQCKANAPAVIVAPIHALMQAVPEPKALPNLTLTLKAGQRYAPGKLTEWLGTGGYERVEVVEQPGQFATRGGIIDIFPPAGAAISAAGEEVEISPIRLDYFDDQIDTIARVDTDTMGSGLRLAEVSILGASVQQLQSDEETTSLLKLLPEATLNVMHEMLEIAEQGRGYYDRLTNPRGIYSPHSVFQHVIARPHVEVNQYSSTADSASAIRMPVRPLPPFDRDAGKALDDVVELTIDPLNQVLVLCEKPAERDRLMELMREHGGGDKPAIQFATAYLHRGFILDVPDSTTPQVSYHLLPHQELFHRYEVRRRIRRVAAEGPQSAEGMGTGITSRAADAFLEVSPGDYVVHADHGIARFGGLKTMRRKQEQEGAAEPAGDKPVAPPEEYLVLEFANKALLHVPVAQIELVQKYVGGYQGRPPLSLLGGKRWTKQKQEAAEAAKELAVRMIQMQAARTSTAGIRYPPDTKWQKEFEAEFPFQETEDQLAAISAIKRDMAQDKPMDRLVCGDVGFGKTEVAIRAAFKAAEFGKQVAVLVPTTILAEQHEQTFRDRMADYPFRVESLSRFKTGTEQKQILGAVAKGQVDVIVGTHRILSQDVRFADLGLVIVDEEQRFGVEHKQRLLEFRLTADVLTLSATPIPRTLHMALLGLRDISSLTTAPRDRRAIVTEVIPDQDERIKNAIVRELSREGQVYFVHNRVHNIQSVADRIQGLVPDARIVIGHGQMAGHELEETMLRFMRKEANILVCTTIIESGLDISNANTIFINRADQFGLSDLHQLRGRVGRWKHRAYCYLILDGDKPVSDAGAQRLRAIEQYAMLGAGFKIAMRDLEIRGAGNLLGAEQSGHIASVGYDMYCRLLEQAASKLKNIPILDPGQTHLELPITGQIPKTYIASDRFRIEAYRRVARAHDLGQLDAVTKDLAAAYGPPPALVQTLLDLAELRIAAATLGINTLKLEGPDLVLRTPTPAKLDPYLKNAPGRASVIDDKTIYYRPPANYLNPPSTLLAVLRKLLVRPLREPSVIAEAKPEDSPPPTGPIRRALKGR